MPIEKIYLAIIKNAIGDTNESIKLLKSVGRLSNAWAKRAEYVVDQLCIR